MKKYYIDKKETTDSKKIELMNKLEEVKNKLFIRVNIKSFVYAFQGSFINIIIQDKDNIKRFLVSENYILTDSLFDYLLGYLR